MTNTLSGLPTIEKNMTVFLYLVLCTGNKVVMCAKIERSCFSFLTVYNSKKKKDYSDTDTENLEYL